MNPTFASLICACGIAGLFYLDRDSSLRTSRALWLPVIWIWIVGSRPVSAWLGVTPTGANAELDGSPVDAAVLGVLLAAAIGVLIRRNRRTRTLLAANWPILIYFFYCLISVAWSYHPDVAFKRWIKATGDLAMVLIITTEPQFRDALCRLFSRVGFLLFPTSLLLIKYYGELGRGYTPDGDPMNTGVSANKNMLGVMLLVISLGTVWHILSLIRAKSQPDRSRHLLAQGVLLAFGIALLGMANSATSTACFMLGSGLILTARLRAIRSRPARVHTLCLAIILAGGLTFLSGGEGGVAEAMGRKSNLSGRTEIWAAVIPATPNSMVGAGFESFWISPNVQKVRNSLSGWWHPEDLNEAHNGYIEVYLQLGWVGVGLITLILISGYRHAVAAFHKNRSIGSLMVAYIIAAAVYSITEAGFRMLDAMWIFLLLGVVSASGIAAGLFGGNAPKIRGSRGGTASRTPAANELMPEEEKIYTAQYELIRCEITHSNNRC
jgi:exopolysaccharide production protein ExoQ